MTIPPPVHCNVRADDFEQQLASLPAAPGVYTLSLAGSPVHVAWSVNLRRRLQRLLVSSYTANRASVATLRTDLTAVNCWPTGSKLESSLLLYHLTKIHSPNDYLFKLRLRMPWFVAITESDPFPRLTVVNRIPRKYTSVYGPFRTRDLAQQYEQQVTALFQIRRCTDSLSPAPEHPGCIYGEMNQCLRPCQCVVTLEEYATEVRRVADFLASNGRSALAVLAGARDRAAEQTGFEEAAQIHKRMEKMKATADLRAEAVAEVRHFNGIALTRSCESRRYRLWPMFQGLWQSPVAFDFSFETAQPRSLDRELREHLNEALAHPTRTGKPLDDLAIFSRWYYSSWRDGLWFPFHSLADLNYRRLVREISNLVKADTPT